MGGSSRGKARPPPLQRAGERSHPMARPSRAQGSPANPEKRPPSVTTGKRAQGSRRLAAALVTPVKGGGRPALAGQASR